MDLLAITILAGIAGFIYLHSHKVKVDAALAHAKETAAKDVAVLDDKIKAVEAAVKKAV